MAEEEATGTRAVTTSARELLALADRLFNRGISTVMRDQPEQQADLMFAARAIRALLEKIDVAATHCNETAKELRTIKIDGGGA